jgi:hypothetical protein
MIVNDGMRRIGVHQALARPIAAFFRAVTSGVVWTS